MSEGSPPRPIEPPEWVSKGLATLDAVSGYTFAFFALADGLILWGPSPFYGVDLTPLRSKWGDWLLAGSILRLWLAAAKVVRSLHGVAGRALSRRAEIRAEESAARKDEKVKAAAKAEALERIKVRCSSLSEGDSYVIAFCLLNNQ